MYVPDNASFPRPAILFLCGHHDKAKQQDEYLHVCRILVKAGLIVLSQDPVGQGERLGYYEESIKDNMVTGCSYEHHYCGSQCWPIGDGLARYFLHDAIRSIDYLASRPEVDSLKIGVTGNSGGGTQTSLLMLCDDRIAAAAPATFITNEKVYMYTGLAQDAEQVWRGMTAQGFCHEDILISMTPKPVLVLAVDSDYFPLEGTMMSYKKARRFWEMYGSVENIEIFIDKSTHCYTENMAKTAAVFFLKHLAGKESLIDEDMISVVEPSNLLCTKTGQVKGDFKNAKSVFDENKERLRTVVELRNSFPEGERRENALRWLSDKVFSGRTSCDTNPCMFSEQRVYDLLTKHVMWRPQEGISNYAVIFRRVDFYKTRIPVTIALWDGGTSDIHPHIDFIREMCAAGRAVLVLDTTGIGNIIPESLSTADPMEYKGVIFHLNNMLMMLDDSIAAIRVHDLLRTIDMLDAFKDISDDDIKVYTCGRHVLYGKLAYFLDKRISEVICEKGIRCIEDLLCTRYYDNYDISSFIIPEMLKYFDLTDIDRWVGNKRNGMLP